KTSFFLVIDDAHVLYPWGKDFRKAYREIALLHRRLPGHIGLVACPNIRIICKELTHTLGGSEFPVGVPCIAGVAKWLLDVLAGVVKWRFRGFVGS
ncbi:hypothetical protein BDN70DRAFT_878717, partial [Pholiota conissans]